MPGNVVFPLGMQFADKSVLVKADLLFDCFHTTKASLSKCLLFVIDFFMQTKMIKDDYFWM